MIHPESWKGMRKFLQKESLVDILRLIRSDNVGPVTFFSLVHQFGAAKNALDAIRALRQGAAGASRHCVIGLRMRSVKSSRWKSLAQGCCVSAMRNIPNF